MQDNHLTKIKKIQIDDTTKILIDPIYLDKDKWIELGRKESYKMIIFKLVSVCNKQSLELKAIKKALWKEKRKTNKYRFKSKRQG